MLFFIWGNKMVTKQKAGTQTLIPSAPSDAGKPDSQNHTDPSQYPNSEWIRNLAGICSQYTPPGFYVTELIPDDLLQMALKTYPLFGGGKPIALIDATFSGTAKNGMLIGEHGLSWHHSLGHSNTSTISWSKFSELAILVDGTKIKIGNDAVFETCGTDFDIEDIMSLLVRIRKLWTGSITSAENRNPISSTQCIDSEWRRVLTDICAQYSAPDYFVGESIPKGKLECAMKKYPLEGGGKAIALVDTSFFGSAERGMLIGDAGISWNFLLSPGNISTMTWAEYSGHMASFTWDRNSDAYAKAFAYRIGEGLILPASPIRRELETLLSRIGELYKEKFEDAEIQDIKPDDWVITLPEPTKPPLPEALAQPLFDTTDINKADFDSLLDLPGIGAADAKIIIQRRISNGPFVSMNELAMVLSLKPHIVERLRPIIAFSMATPKHTESQLSPPPAVTAPDPSPPQLKQTGPSRAPIDF
jgi:hypothetical protein